MTSVDEQLRLLCENAAEVIPVEELEAKLKLGRPLRVKLGLDPTAGDVTLGWSVPLRKLRRFQDLGHTAVLIVGDYTAQIGDPSDRESTRPMRTQDEVEAHASQVLDQFSLVLSEQNLEVRRNSEWLEALGTTGLLQLSTHYTVARMLERDDFAKRFAGGVPISVREFLYPLLQAYDSVAVQADVELGGTDQHFNLMVARHVQRVYGQEPQVVMTMPLIEGTDGVHAMSQSRGNYIGVTESPDQMFGKLMRVPDEVMGKYLRLTTDLATHEISALEARLPPQELKRVLAKEVVKLYHGDQAAATAAERFDLIFVEGEIPQDVPESAIPHACVSDGVVFMPQLLKELGLVGSNGEGRRLIEQGGVSIGGDKVSSESVPVSELRGRVLRIGKHRFVRLT